MSDARTYTFDHVDAAMCLWEEIINPELTDAPRPWEAYHTQWGSAALRELVLTRLAGPCCDAWLRAYNRYDQAETERIIAAAETGDDTILPSVAEDPGSFDWEFVPLWVRECVDWSDVTKGPRVKGSKA